MIVDVHVECWFDSGVHGGSILNINLWKGKDMYKRCVIETNMEQEKIQLCSSYVILTTTVVVYSCGTIDNHGIAWCSMKN